MAAPMRRSYFSGWKGFLRSHTVVTYTFVRKNNQGRPRFEKDAHKYKHIDDPDLDPEFRILKIPGFTQVEEKITERKSYIKTVQPPRTNTMKMDQDWTSVWPAAETFKWSVVPLQVRQGAVDRLLENKGIPPGKYANAELMKIPNFLHLTPKHVRKHCAALKKFCTKWPAGLETDEQCEKHFPITTITSDYLSDGPTVQDPRARKVEVKFRLSSLELDYHARDKLLRLVGDRYDKKTDLITLLADRCPLKAQNKDYAMYLLTAVFYESWKVEPWEAEKTVLDMETYCWDLQESRKNIVALVQHMTEQYKDAENGKEKKPSYISELPENATEEDIVSTKPVQLLKDSLEELNNEGESKHSLDKYRDAVRQVLSLPKFEEQAFPGVDTPADSQHEERQLSDEEDN